MADTEGWGGARRHDEAGLGRLLNVIKEQDRRIAALERGAPLRAAGIGASPEGLTVHSSLEVDGSLNVSGDADFSGDTTIGGELDVGADTSIRGNLKVEDGGQFRVKHPGGNQDAVYVGDIYDNGGAGPYDGTGLLVENADGSDLFAAHSGRVAAYDPRGNSVMIVSDDRGLTAPAFTVHCAPEDYRVWPGTESSSWATIYEGTAFFYSPNFRLIAQAVASDGTTTGDARIALEYDGTEYVLDTLTGIGFGFQFPSYDGAVPSQIPMGGFVYVRLQGRRASGTGSLRGVITQAVLYGV